MNKIGINLLWPEPPEIQMPVIKRVGFDCILMNYFENEPVGKYAREAEKIGLEIAMVHAPIADSNSFWINSPKGDDYVDFQKTRIDFCSEFGIKKLVMHATFGKDTPPVSEIGAERFKRLCDYAQEKNVHLAFENVDIMPHLIKVMELADPYHGFCWDCGHNMAYHPETDMLSLFGDRLICTHIHDNFSVTRPGEISSSDDKHLIPFDGVMNWVWYAKKLMSVNYKEPLTLETSRGGKPEYKDMPFEEYLEKAAVSAKKLQSLCK